MYRIVCLTPSAYDIVCALGLEECLVAGAPGNGPNSAGAPLPVCVRPAPPDAPGGDGPLQMLPAVEWRVDWELAEALAPTHILAHGDARTSLLFGAAPQALQGRIHLAPPCAALADIWRVILDTGAALDRHDVAVDLVISLQSRMAAIVNQAIGLIARPRVAVLEWIDPPVAAGAYLPELIEMAGGKCLLRRPGDDSAPVELEQLAAEAPETVLLACRGLPIPRAREETVALTNLPGWWDLPAARREQVYVADGLRYFHAPGPQVVETLEIIAEILHPEEFQFGHGGDAWQQL